MLLKFFLNEERYFYLEEFYMLNYEKDLIKERLNLPISNKIIGLKTYKNKFILMSRIRLFEEEAIN
jgi:hypothetical protein